MSTYYPLEHVFLFDKVLEKSNSPGHWSRRVDEHSARPQHQEKYIFRAHMLHIATQMKHVCLPETQVINTAWYSNELRT